MVVVGFVGFPFGFLNINEHEDTKEIIIDKQYKDILEKLEAKDTLTSAEQELIKTIIIHVSKVFRIAEKSKPDPFLVPTKSL